MGEALELSKRLPTEVETEKALEAMRALARTSTKAGALPICVHENEDGENVIELPPAVGQILLDLLMHIGRGEAVTFVPFGAELTTQQAADMLNVSRPFLVKLIEKGQLPHHKVGAHRRIRASDLLDYKQRREEERDAALTELARLGQEFDAE